jgi:hypothetical protein
MSLSADHQALLEQIVQWCTARLPADNYIVLTDSFERTRHGPPPKIAGHRPDLVWVRADGSFEVIGEAKTRNDIDNDHTRRQLCGFLQTLDIQGYGKLVVAVPWGFEAVATSTLVSLQRQAEIQEKRWTVIYPCPTLT